MPNWATNEVVVVGKPEVLTSLINTATRNGESNFEMANIVPMPESEKENWYEWNINNWGTKWDIDDLQVSPSDIQIEDGNGVLRFGYSTAWSPNLEFWSKVSEQFAIVVNHDYYEEGMNYIGQARIENGVANDYCVDITKEMYVKAGLIFDEDGEADWDNSDVDLSVVFPL